MDPIDRLIMYVPAHFGPPSLPLLANLCELDVSALKKIVGRLQDRGYVDVSFVYAKETPQLSAPVYAHRKDAPRSFPKRHFNELSNRLRGRSSAILERTPIIVTTPTGVEMVGGVVPDLSKPFQASHWLGVASLVVLGHSLAVERRRRHDSSVIEMVSPNSLANFSPLLSPAPASAGGSPGSIADSEAEDDSLLRASFDARWYGEDWLIREGLRCGSYVPDLALVEGQKIIHAVDLATDYSAIRCSEIHHECVKHAATFELFGGRP